MSRSLRISIAAIAAMMLPAPANAQDTVKVGQETKRAAGTITSMNAGDTACYLELKDDRGASFEEMARFEICEQQALLGKRVALTYVLQNVMSPDCQGDPGLQEDTFRRCDQHRQACCASLTASARRDVIRSVSSAKEVRMLPPGHCAATIADADVRASA